MIGRTLLHYQIVDKLGVGGMGEVYKAFDTKLGRPVALKFLPESYQHDPSRRARFFTEAQAVARLNSPYIAALYDIAEDGGMLFLVIEYVPGATLGDRLAAGALEIDRAVDVCSQLLSALGEAHGKGIVHRDIKPANIMLDDAWRVKVLDFGLAKIADSSNLEADQLPTVVLPHQTLPGSVMGTVAYMSPEQAVGKAVDHRSDLFSAGILFFQMLTGTLPFTGETSTETLTNIVHLPAPALRSLLPHAPLGLEAVIANALGKDVLRRYQTAEEFQTDLLLVQGGQGGRIGGRGSDQLKTNVSMPSVDSGLDTLIEDGKRMIVPNSIAVMTFQNVTRNPDDDWIGSGIAETVSSDLKNVKGVVVIGRERVFDALRAVTTGLTRESDDEHAIRIGRHIGARWMVSGGYQKLTEAIRVTARLIDADSGTVLESVKLDGKVSDIFEVQDRIVVALSVGLNVSVGTSELRAIEKAETVSIEAYERYAKGMTCLRAADRKSMDAAIEHFQAAVDRDPSYSLAWAALGAAHNLKGAFLAQPDLINRAVEFELKALGLNPNLAFAHEQLGSAFTNLGRFEDAVAALQTALRLTPGQASSHSTLGRAYWLGLGRLGEGANELESAIAIDPNQGYAFMQLGLIYSMMGELERAESVCRRAVNLQERSSSGTVGLKMVGAHTRLGYVMYLQKRYREALAEYDRERRWLMANDHALGERSIVELDVKEGAAWLRLGDGDRARGAFDRARAGFARLLERGADEPFTRYYLACAAALLDEPDAAFEHLQTSLKRLPALTRVRVGLDPDLAGLRDDPRFERIASPPAG